MDIYHMPGRLLYAINTLFYFLSTQSSEVDTIYFYFTEVETEA